MEGHESNLTPSEREGPAPDDAELEALEAEMAPVLGDRAGMSGPASDQNSGPVSDPNRGPGSGHGEAAMAVSAERRAELRAAFVTGQFPGDEALEAPLEKALRAWEVPVASDRAREVASRALLDGEPLSSEPVDVRELRPATPTPRSASRRLRLVVGASLLAAAAAALLILGPSMGEADPRWSLDDSMVAALEGPDAFDGFTIDGRKVASIDEVNDALVTGRHVVNGGEMIRIRRGAEFVLEISAGAMVNLESTVGGASTGTQQIFVDHGSVRIATGPDFDSQRPLVLLSPHVRSEVVGTIFGVDVADSYTCVCCIEGKVRTTPLSSDCDPMDVNGGQTRVVRAEGDSIEVALVDHHGRYLVLLRNLTAGGGYWL